MCMTHKKEANDNLANDPELNEHRQKRKDITVLVLSNAVVHLEGHIIVVRKLLYCTILVRLQ